MLETISLPSTLKEMSPRTFGACVLKTIYVEEGFELNVEHEFYYLPVISPSRRIRVGTELLWDLRALKAVAIPEGVEKIGAYWFSDSGIESVDIAASVRELGAGAFRRCKNLLRVSFQPDSSLEKIGDMCFRNDAFEKIFIPRNVAEI